MWNRACPWVEKTGVEEVGGPDPYSTVEAALVCRVWGDLRITPVRRELLSCPVAGKQLMRSVKRLEIVPS